MTDTLSPADTAKLAAAERAVSFVQDGMRLGLGTGSTAAWMVRCLGRRVRDEGLQIVGVPTSEQTAVLARAEGIEIVTLEEAGWLDLAIDGADEFDGDLNLIKGGGGALLREKIVASASNRMIVIADAGKHVAQLGDFSLPVEVIRFGWQSTRDQIAELLEEFDVARREITLRLRDDAPFATDEGNYILDLALGQIADPRHLALLLNQIPGTVENGLFIDLCDLAIVGHVDGNVTLVERSEDADGFDDAV